MSRRAVITGIGVVAPTGIGAAEHWKTSQRGECRITPFTRYPTIPIHLAGQVPGFDETEYIANRLIVQTDRWTQFALAAMRMAIDDAALDLTSVDPYDVSVVTAAASGGNEFGQREIQALWARHPSAVSSYQSIAWFYAASTGQIAILHKLKGSCGVVVADTAGGLDALGEARRIVERGGVAVAVGGTEAPLTPYALVCQASLGRLSTVDDPAHAYRPFAPSATGYVPGEGGAMLLVEEAEAARARSASVYAEIVGQASTHDAYHHSDPAPDGVQLARAMTLALRRSGLAPEDVDLVFVDAAGDPVSDAAEVRALDLVFGERTDPVAVTAPKTMTGRLYSGGAALDVAWAALALAHGVVPPTVHVGASSLGPGLDLVTEARRPATLRTALVVARGVGGFNSALVLRGLARM